MHRLMSALIGAGAGSATNAWIGDDIATVVIFLISAGHVLPPNVVAAITRLTSGLVVAITIVATNWAMSRWGDQILPAKIPSQ